MLPLPLWNEVLTPKLVTILLPIILTCSIMLIPSQRLFAYPKMSPPKTRKKIRAPGHQQPHNNYRSRLKRSDTMPHLVFLLPPRAKNATRPFLNTWSFIQPLMSEGLASLFTLSSLTFLTSTTLHPHNLPPWHDVT